MRRLLAFFSTLERIEHTLHHVSRKVDLSMSLAQEIIDGIAGLTSSVTALQDSTSQVVAGIDRLVSAGTLSPEQGQAILGSLVADRAAVDTSRAALDAEVVKLAAPPVQ